MGLFWHITIQDADFYHSNVGAAYHLPSPSPHHQSIACVSPIITTKMVTPQPTSSADAFILSADQADLSPSSINGSAPPVAHLQDPMPNSTSAHSKPAERHNHYGPQQPLCGYCGRPFHVAAYCWNNPDGLNYQGRGRYGGRGGYFRGGYGNCTYQHSGECSHDDGSNIRGEDASGGRYCTMGPIARSPRKFFIPVLTSHPSPAMKKMRMDHSAAQHIWPQATETIQEPPSPSVHVPVQPPMAILRPPATNTISTNSALVDTHSPCGPDQRPPLFCDYCDRPNHSEEFCWDNPDSHNYRSRRSRGHPDGLSGRGKRHDHAHDPTSGDADAHTIINALHQLLDLLTNHLLDAHTSSTPPANQEQLPVSAPAMPFHD